MIPNIPLLKTPIKYSGFSNSSYNPYNLILKIDGKIENDLSFNHLIEYNTTLIHEWTHWIQHHGSTFGVFLHALKYTQEQTTLGSLRELPQQYSRDLLFKRNENKAPIIFIDPKTGNFRPQKFKNNSDFINLYGQIWFDIQWIKSFLNDTRISATTGVPPGQIFGDSIGDIFLHYFSKEKQDQKEVFESREWYNFEDNIQIVRFGGVDVTSHLLMECSSTINEIQFLLNNIHTGLSKSITEEHFNSRIKVLIETRYGLPLKLFLTILNLDFVDIGRICSTVNILIFIALNPPLPPFCKASPKGRKSWQWTEIYPPLRFIKALEAIKKVGLLKSSPNHFETKEYIQKVIEISKISTVLENDFQNSNSFRKFDFSDPNLNFDPDNISFDSYDYTYWVQQNFSTVGQ